MSIHTKRLGALSLLTIGAVLLSACSADATVTPAPMPTATTSVAVQPTNTPCPCLAPDATSTSTGTPSTSAGATEVRIGFAFVTSGDNAVYGTSQKAAAQIAISEINTAGEGPKITPIFEDTAGKPNQAFTIFQKFINSDKVDAIIGPTLSNEAKTADPEAQKDAVPVLAVSNTASGITDIGDYIYRDSLAEAQVIPETVKEVKDKLSLSKVSLMYAGDDAFSKSGADVFRAELQKNGIKILSEQTFSTNDIDFKTQLQAVKAENPDAIVVSALAKPAQLIMQQARNDIGIDPKVHIIGDNGFNSPTIVTNAGASAEGMIVGAAWNLNSAEPLSQKFVASYKAASGKNPDQFAAQAYAGVYILYDAIKRANIDGKSLADARTAIRDALKGTSSLETVLGKFSFTDARDANHPPVVQIVTNGTFDVLK